MAIWLLDTNILLHLVSGTSPRHAASSGAVERMVLRDERPAYCMQTLCEFWSVATRPSAVNGLGWPVPDVCRAIDAFRRDFEPLQDSPEVMDRWLDLVTRYGLKGKRVHDAHLLATMMANGVTNLLTCNGADFPAVDGITIQPPEL